MASVRADIMEYLRKLIASQDYVRGAEYDRPFSLERQDYPWAWLYDFDERYDHGQYVGRTECALTAGVLVAFRYDEHDGLRTRGTDILARVLRTICDDQQTRDPEHTGLQFVCLPTRSDIYDGAERTQHVGITAVTLDVEYQTPFANPFTQLVA